MFSPDIGLHPTVKKGGGGGSYEAPGLYYLKTTCEQIRPCFLHNTACEYYKRLSGRYNVRVRSVNT